jgi:hypothetical protein
VVKIGDSVPAPLFNVVAQPNDWQKAVKASTGASAGGGKSSLYQAFWEKFIEELRVKHPGWSRARSAPAQNWFSMSSGVSGLTLGASFAANGRVRSEVYIERPSQEECKAVFDQLLAQREAFEGAYGRPLEWERLDHAKACRIAEYIAGDVTDPARHGELLAFFQDAGARMRQALAAVDLSV